MPVPGTSVANHVQSGQEDIVEYRYLAPEVQWLEDNTADKGDTTDKILITKESDVYGMGMVAYEASFHRMVSSGPRVNLTLISQVLTGSIPYSKHSNIAVLPKIQEGEMLQRPLNKITDPVWEFLEECWSRVPTNRPSTAQVCSAFSQFCSNPEVAPTLEGRPAMEELPAVEERLDRPGKLKLRVHSIKISLNKPNQQSFSVEFKYGKEQHNTLQTTGVAAGDEHTWYGFHPFLLPRPSLSPKQEPCRSLVD